MDCLPGPKHPCRAAQALVLQPCLAKLKDSVRRQKLSLVRRQHNPVKARLVSAALVLHIAALTLLEDRQMDSTRTGRSRGNR